MYCAPENLANDLGIDIPKYPLAILAQMTFPRIINQLGTFTIHPKPKEGFTLPEILKEERHLVRYIIPSGCKNKLRKHLAALARVSYLWNEYYADNTTATCFFNEKWRAVSLGCCIH